MINDYTLLVSHNDGMLQFYYLFDYSPNTNNIIPQTEIFIVYEHFLCILIIQNSKFLLSLLT